MSEEQNKDSRKQAEEMAAEVRDRLRTMDLPEVNFINFISGFATQAFMQLGLAPHPITGKAEIDLRTAKYSIDCLDMLGEKTKGNLSEEEQTFMDKLLFDLRMTYINAGKKTATPEE